MPKTPPDQKYPNMPEEQVGTLADLRDRLYEDHGCISHTQENRALVNLFYHMMYELTLAINPNEVGWQEDENFQKVHEEMMQLMDYRRPNHPYSN